ncbi:MAG: AMP-binding protein, partial [Anaerolineales bacterium]|nr:AMP-binding protein [Anaerolineales bacterium]
MNRPEQDWLKARAYASPHKLALLIAERRWTYNELDQLVDQTAVWLNDLGIPANKRIGVLMNNSIEYVCLVYAIARVGAVLIPLNARLTAAELAWQVAQVGCELVIASEELGGELSIVNCQLAIVNEATLTSTPPLTIDHWPLTIDNLTPQAIVFTSGTTGHPKGVELTFGNHFYSAMGSAYKLGVDINDLWLSCLPLYHVGGLAVIFRSCLYGTAVDLHPRFDLDEVNHALDNKPITLISVVPTMLYRLVQTRDNWPESMRLILVGGAAASIELVETANRLGQERGSGGAEGRPLVATSYGMTEASSQIATLLPEDAQRKPASVGKPLLFTQVKIVDDRGEPQPDGDYGEIWVKGPNITQRYVNNEQANQERFIDGWFRTGDIGYFDDEGDLWIVQRRSDLIVSGGENVYPAEV